MMILYSVGSQLLANEAGKIALGSNWEQRHSESAERFCELFDHNAVGCIIFDRGNLGIADLTQIRDISREYWKVPILVIDDSPTIERAVEVFHVGANDYAGRPVDWRDLQTRSEQVTRDAAVAFQRVQHLAKRLRSLSKREGEILRLLLNANKAVAIARQLGICEKTVENARARIFDKLNVGSLAELFKLWIDSGIAFPSEPDSGGNLGLN